jgi:hypothetical protein
MPDSSPNQPSFDFHCYFWRFLLLFVVRPLGSTNLLAFSVELPVAFLVVTMVIMTTVPPKRPAYASTALLTTIGLREGVTQVLKLLVQRKRPIILPSVALTRRPVSVRPMPTFSTKRNTAFRPATAASRPLRSSF